jgi:transposase
MDVSKFKVPGHWPPDAREFAHEAMAEIQELKTGMKHALAEIISLKDSLGKAQAETRDLKDKLGVNSSNSGLPPSKDPPSAPPSSTKPTGRKHGAQPGHSGSGRKLFPLERIDRTVDVFPQFCPISRQALLPEDLISMSLKRIHQVDLPEKLRPVVTEIRLHTCLCTCGCGNKVSASMPAELGNTAVGPRLKAVMALLASRFHLSKTLIQELLIDLFGSDAAFSTGCISEAEAEISASLERSYQEGRAKIRQEAAVHVDESGWFLKHKVHWLWVAVTSSLSVFFIDPNRSRAAFERFLGDFEGIVISDRYSAYSRLSPEDRQLCWAHLIRDFRRLVDRHGGAEGIGAWALKEIETMFGLWRLYLDGAIDQVALKREFVTLRARFARLLKLGQNTKDKKATTFCRNLTDLWPALWNFVQRPDLLQPTNNKAEQAIRQAVIGRSLSLGSQSDRGLRFVERMLTVVTTLRKQGRRVLSFLQQALLSFRLNTPSPSLLECPSG